MGNTSKNQPTSDEQKVLSELQKNSRNTIDAIAKNCGFSRQKVYRIIKQLESTEKIWGYSVTMDETPEKQKFILFLKKGKGVHDPRQVKELLNTQMDSLKEELGVTVLHSYFIHGDYDLVTVFTAKDIMVAKKFVAALINKFPATFSIRINQVLYTLREQYIRTPHPEQMKDFI
ncbi:MAG: Lrp/AsnC family transcriptional regulator [Candidatus Thermoplasmatota archaeon]|jgi:DNA-binding Lrp family transcriptional regulator|nr:Lrp/AsnC family transcriptional regulator [Candidatus Thermoplasmatota archaeon]